ncbi:MAG: prepilin-type N-terminal cleavage/methylation domain-containing protein [Acidobacteria bacterium]|nr:prepilin-type N-terminal cleavage/methylation domain-containing protein [Acidobacteriota bacterium]
MRSNTGSMSVTRARCRRSARQPDEASSPAPGFSLIEMLVVLSLAILCFTITFPVVADMLERYSSSSAASTIASDLLVTRYRAITDSTSYRVRFEGEHGYAIERLERGEWSRWRVRSFGDAIELRSNNNPVFNAAGSVSNMASIYIVSGGHRHRKITIAITGRVKVARLP